MKSFYEKWGWLMLIPLLGYGLLGDDKGHTYLILFGLSIFTLIIALALTASDEVGEEQNSKERNMVKRLFTKDMAVLWWIIFGVLAVITYVYYEDNWYRF